MQMATQTAVDVSVGGGSPQAGRIALVPFLHRVIDGLVRGDAEELHRLLQSLTCLALMPMAAEFGEAQPLHRLLGALLQETQRNLRLLRRVADLRTRQSYGASDS
jgi:hypothetical protein